MSDNNAPVSADASSYVRNCNDPTLLGMHPVWIVFVIVAFFVTFWLVQVFCLMGVLFCAYSAKSNATLFDMVRRIRRKIAGPDRKFFRSI
jgi:hypothetical protein